MSQTLVLDDSLCFSQQSAQSQDASGEAPARAQPGKCFPLMLAQEGEAVRIEQLQGGKGLVMRLTELGLNQGAEVRVIQRQGCGLVVARGETRIALGAGMASKVLVKVVAA